MSRVRPRNVTDKDSFRFFFFSNAGAIARAALKYPDTGSPRFLVAALFASPSCTLLFSLSVSLSVCLSVSTLPRLRLYLSLHLCLLGRAGARDKPPSRRRFSLSRAPPPPPQVESERRTASARGMYHDARRRRTAALDSDYVIARNLASRHPRPRFVPRATAVERRKAPRSFHSVGSPTAKTSSGRPARL